MSAAASLSACFELLVERCLLSLPVKAGKGDKLAKQFHDEPNRGVLEEFIREPDVRCVYCYTEASERVVVSLTPEMKKKGVFLLKSRQVQDGLRLEEVRQQLCLCECSEDILSHLSLVSHEVFFPLLANPANRAGWSGPTAKEVMMKVSAFLSSITIAVGQSKGQTLLPHPPPEAFEEDALQERERVHLLESAVIAWSAKVEAVLSSDSDAVLRQSAAAALQAEKEAEASKRSRQTSVAAGGGAASAAVPAAAAATGKGGAGDEAAEAAKAEKAAELFAEKERANLAAFPGPQFEVEFWHNKAADLASLAQQLASPKLLQVHSILHHFSSAYADQLGRLQADVRQCAVECASNNRFLRPLRPLFVQLTEELDFTRLEATFHPLFHTTLLIFQHSPYYNHSTRLSALLQMCANALITQANKHVNGEAVFRLIEDENTAEAVTLIRQTIRTAERFKATFHHYQRKAAALFTDPAQATYRSWEVDSDVLFSRLDAYVERANDLLDFCRVVLEFSKLQKVFIGGTKGKELTAALWQVHSDFVRTIAQFKRVDYDLLDISVAAFDADLYTYRSQVKELEKRLAASLLTAFNESATLSGRFQLLDGFEGLLERPTIKDELDKKLSSLLSMYSDEVKAVQDMFHKGRHSPKIDTNMPPIAGALSWVRALRSRVEEPMEKLRFYVNFLSSAGAGDAAAAAAQGSCEGEREEMRELLKAQASLVQQLSEYEARALQEWSADIDSSSDAKLQQPLLRRDASTGLLYVNFDGGLVKLLREVKYFLLLHISVPSTALLIYDKAELYRQQISHLEYILSMYNEMVSTLHKVERPLVERELRAIDLVLQRGLEQLNWKDETVNSFINEAIESVKQTHQTVRLMKDHLSSIRRAMSDFAAVPLCERKNKPLSPSDFEDNLRKLWQQRHTLLVEVGEQVNKWLEETRKAVGDPSPEVWSTYVDYVQDGVRDGLALAIVNSLRFLCDQVDPTRADLAPLLEVKLGLYANEVAFNAEDLQGSGAHSSRGSVGGGGGEGADKQQQQQAALIQQAALMAANPATDLATSPATLSRRIRRDVWALVRDWVDSFFDIGRLITRQDGSSYVSDLKRDPSIQRYLALLNAHLDANSRQSQEVRAEYVKYDFLWKTDRQVEFHRFLAQAIAEAKLTTAEEEKKRGGKNSGAGEAQKGGGGEGVANGGGGGGAGGDGGRDDDKEEEEGEGLDLQLPLDRFEERILYYRDVAAELGEKRSPVDIGWLKVNASPIKVALQSWANRWVTTFTHFLYHDVTKKLHSLEALMAEVNEGLTTEVVAGDSATLKRVLGYIHSIRSQEKSTTRLFQPLRDTVSLLKKYGKNLDETEMKLLSDAPMKWDSTVNAVYRVKERVNVLQNDEVDKIKERVDAFDVELRRVRADYKENAPFAYDCAVNEAYDLIHEYHDALNALEERAAKLTDLEKVFELNVSKHRQIRKCRAENRLLKVVWDMGSIIKHQCEDWKKTRWNAIDTDELLAETKKLQKSLLQLPSEVQGWDVYSGLSGEVKNLLTVLPLVNLLHSPAMEDRHWRELKVATGKAFVKDDQFCLSSVLELELHRFVNDVEYIVELANKESKISGQLRKIESQWLTLELQFGVSSNGITSIKRPDDILIALEENMAALQGMSGQGKYVEHFIDEVSRWQKLLNHAETVLYDWLDVQGKWSSLEAIFLGSKDIRVQLPEDSARFDDIDRDWKRLMANAQNTPNAIEATSTNARGESLISMKQGLEHCEKSLFQYLETKRKAFPRFYFLSNAALLDILSSGHDPQAVQRHLGDCFPEADTRVLTNSGFLFLSEIEQRVERKEEVLYACYDITKKGLVYSSGDVVLKPNPARWVDFTQAPTRLAWDETSDDYGSTVNRAGKAANYVSLRTTPQHKMYVQFAPAVKGRVRKQGGAAVPPQKMAACELAPGFECHCRQKCSHGYPAYRMLTGAPSGIVYGDVMSEDDKTELLAHRPPGERDSPVMRLGLRSADQLDAFLELYGYWVGDGTMQYIPVTKRPYAVVFKPKKQRDRTYVLDLLARLRLGHDEWTVDDGHTDGCLKIFIKTVPWCLYFDEQYGLKYEDSQHYNREQAIAMLGNGPPSVAPVRRSSASSPRASISVVSACAVCGATGTLQYSKRDDNAQCADCIAAAAEDGSVCCECGDDNTSDANLLLRCTGFDGDNQRCARAVHMLCCTLDRVPAGGWRCEYHISEDDEPSVKDEDDKPSGDSEDSEDSEGMDVDEDEDEDEDEDDEPYEDEDDEPSEDDDPDEPGKPGKPYNPDDEKPAKSCKWFWWWVLKRLDKRQLQLVIEGLRRADGVSKRSKKQKAAGTAFSGLRRICTSSVRFRDALTLACLHAGYSTNFIINTRAGRVRGYNAVPTEYRIYSRAEMKELLAANPRRRFEPVRPNYDNWWVKYTLSTNVKLVAADVRYDGKPLRPRQKRKGTTGGGYVAEHGRFGLRTARTMEDTAKVVSCSTKTISNYADKKKRTTTGWQIFTKAAYDESISGSKSSSSSASGSTAATVAADVYSERDGRTWCVNVKHTDHLIVVQRAHRDARGIVTKATRPLVTGNCFDNIAKLSFHSDSQGQLTKTATGMYSKEGDEYVAFQEPLDCVGPVEDWLGRLVSTMRSTLMDILSKAKFTADHWEIEKPRHRWLFDYPAQLALTASQIQWTEEVNSQFDAFADGNEQAMKEYASKVLAMRLEQLIQLVLGDLTHCDRVKIMTLITVDVHNRDVVQRLIEAKVQDATAFAWQSQMRMKWKPDTRDCLIQVADATFNYSFEYIGSHHTTPPPIRTLKHSTMRHCAHALYHEHLRILLLWPHLGLCFVCAYLCCSVAHSCPAQLTPGTPRPLQSPRSTALTRLLLAAVLLLCASVSLRVRVGNTGRLVITPLTDRCYITLTQALRLIMGGAPAGPAGTGKTETTKDLGRAMGLPVYVFNCSEQMNVQSLGTIFKGLAQTGAWGCFDEFNRIPIEVLSVVSTQVSCILNGVREKRAEFDFMGEVIGLVPSVGMFITMNPGYAGRTELPENLKALFRSCAMVVPDMNLICENMLMSEGFLQAQRLAKKFTTLYSLSSELLSKQKHYDWGLRATKAVLRIAGGMKRAEPKVDEDRILMRALRDSNLAKLVDDDKPIFRELINDLFPGLGGTERKVDPKLQEAITLTAQQRGLQAEETFVFKCLELAELLSIRHSVFVIGPAGCGKSEVWKTLYGAYKAVGKKAIYEVINPKAIRNNELYGWLSKTDWHDGVLSTVMRNMSRNRPPYTEEQQAKWVVLDGDIDPNWIESLNTVMDDNKMLTLVSNERIPLSPSMRMMFEISNLDNATPATVSRAGILFINARDIGSKPFLDSWIERRDNDKEKSSLLALFNKYCTPEYLHEMLTAYQRIIPVSEVTIMRTLCYLLEGLLARMQEAKKARAKLDPTPMEPAVEKEQFEANFVFAVIWAFGGAALVDKVVDTRKDFSDFFRRVFTTIKFPKEGHVFDYYPDVKTGKMVPWSDSVPEFHAPDDAYLVTKVFVPTVDTASLSFVLDLLVQRSKHVLLVGSAGTGKTVLVNSYLHSLGEGMLYCNINLNYYTDAKSLQQQMEGHVDKRSGRIYGPPTSKRLIYFIDDLNMPAVDAYGTQSPSCLIKQHMDYGAWYDTGKLEKKEIQDVQYVACMNPTAGSFTVDPRLQGLFSTFACLLPSKKNLSHIYSTVLLHHFAKFHPSVQEVVPRLIKSTIELHDNVSLKFIPSTKKFHYQFNLRDLSNVFQGLCLAQAGESFTAKMVVQLWYHECTRVFSDRLVSPEDCALFAELLDGKLKAEFKEVGELKKEAGDEVLFTSFMSAAQPAYLPCDSMSALKLSLEGKLAAYNEELPIMNLELFSLAIQHVCRIARIIENPRGNALLVGVGGSGKQSLAKLASYICGYDVFQITVSQSYGLNDLRVDLQGMYIKAGVKNLPLTWLLTDTQIVDDTWLVYVNDLLSSGNIADLFSGEDKDSIINQVRNEARQRGVADSREALYEFFIQQVRTNLHVVLCFSPVGELFRIRCRKFPGLISCTTIDWFHPWPRDALISVANRFLAEVEIVNAEAGKIKGAVAEHMAEVHLSVNLASSAFANTERRYNYTTPKSFLELISFYKRLLGKKREELRKGQSRLEKGIATLKQTHAQVADLKKDLQDTLVKVKEKSEAASVLISKMGVERRKVEEQQSVAAVEAEKARSVSDVASKISADCKKELDAAYPILEKAKAAVECLSKASLTTLKSFASPPGNVMFVTNAVLILKNIPGKKDWGAAKKMMKDVGKFLEELKSFDATNIDSGIIDKLQPILQEEWFNEESMKASSEAAANLCAWVVNTVAYNQVYKNVAPKMAAQAAATDELNDAQAKLKAVEDRVTAMQLKLATVTGSLKDATDEKNKVEAEAANCQQRLELANRLVDGLADENTRWAKSILQFEEKGRTLVGDTMLAAAFVSYIGAFNQKFRVGLWKEQWLPDLIQRAIPLTEGVDPLSVLATDSDFAKWKNEGLAADRISLENGAIVTQCSRWPLMIDPQLQGVKWIKGRVKALKVIQLSQKRWMNTILTCVTMGEPLLIEGVGEELDATLDPLLSRSIFQRGSQKMIKLGAEEVVFDDNFQLYIQTKLFNPHYRPEIFAQCTLINFIVTEEGLEEQLLALVVNKEKPELEEKRTALVRAINDYMVSLTDLENELLERLSNAPDDILSDVALIEGLEKTKAASTEIEQKVELAKKQEVSINAARNEFRQVAAEASWLYFLLIQLCTIDHMYQYSLDAFTSFFLKAMSKAKKADSTRERVVSLRESIRITVFTWVNRGLFERHKLIFSSQLCFKLMLKGALQEQFDAVNYDVLIRGPKKLGVEKTIQLDWLPLPAWASIQKLIELNGFDKLASDMQASPNRFKEWYNKARPEDTPLPLEWRKLDDTNPFMKLLVVRAMRPDRMTMAMENYVRTSLPAGKDFTECDAGKSFLDVLSLSLDDASPVTPIFFILSAGADPVHSVEVIAKRAGYYDARFHRVALGEGQDVVAMSRLELGHREGHWIVLENIHLMPRWNAELEKKLDEFAVEGSHPDFRVFLSAEPSAAMPIGILERSIKLTNEPPQGLKANLKRAFASFEKEEFEFKDPKVKSILFGLVHFHSVMIERIKFGPKGWNKSYPFSTGDLMCSNQVLANYLESGSASDRVPWSDLRYIFGEILYGGHITDDWDRLLCSTYLDFYMKEELLDEMEMYPFNENFAEERFRSPPVLPYDQYFDYIDHEMRPENPIAFGLHPNAEIAVKTRQCNELFTAILDLQPRSGGGGGGGDAATSPQALVQLLIQTVLTDKSRGIEGIHFNLDDIASALVDERGPYQNVFLQECDRMNQLCREIRRSLKELDLGLSGELQMSERMELLFQSLYLGRVPVTWAKLAYPSQRSLTSWMDNLILRAAQLQSWTEDPVSIPVVTQISYLFNPQSFLTAIMQKTAQKNKMELDKLVIQTDVTRKTVEQTDTRARDGAYVYGLLMEGARWNWNAGVMEECLPREMSCALPVVVCRAVLADKLEKVGVYRCPCYKTQRRGDTYVFTANLRTKAPAAKWTLAGAVLVMEVEE